MLRSRSATSRRSGTTLERTSPREEWNSRAMPLGFQPPGYRVQLELSCRHNRPKHRLLSLSLFLSFAALARSAVRFLRTSSSSVAISGPIQWQARRNGGSGPGIPRDPSRLLAVCRVVVRWRGGGQPSDTMRPVVSRGSRGHA